MYNREQPPSPQVQQPLMEPSPPRPPGHVDADFEFSPAGSGPMMDADQLFSKGRILPLQEAAPRPPTTLRDELRAAPDAADRGRRGPARWKELLGLKSRGIRARLRRVKLRG